MEASIFCCCWMSEATHVPWWPVGGILWGNMGVGRLGHMTAYASDFSLQNSYDISLPPMGYGRSKIPSSTSSWCYSALLTSHLILIITIIIIFIFDY